MAKTSDTKRDRTRRPHAKRATLSRRAERRAKYASLFLTLAFPAALPGFSPLANLEF